MQINVAIEAGAKLELPVLVLGLVIGSLGRRGKRVTLAPLGGRGRGTPQGRPWVSHRSTAAAVQRRRQRADRLAPATAGQVRVVDVVERERRACRVLEANRNGVGWIESPLPGSQELARDGYRIGPRPE